MMTRERQAGAETEKGEEEGQGEGSHSLMTAADVLDGCARRSGS